MPHAAEKIAACGTEPPARHVRLFRNGANQAVRIPKEFELPGKEAMMHREGNRLVIEAIEPKHPKGSAAALLAVLATMEAVDEEFPDVDEGLLPMEDVEL